MQDYVIFTDSSCDISPEQLAEWGVPFAHMTFTFEGDPQEYTNAAMSFDVFYDRMRQGGHPKTAAINAATFCDAFTPYLEAGKDILYIALSSGLSTTVASAHMAVEELQAQFPERTVRVIDSLAASAGVGFLVYLAVQKKKQGADLEENAAYLNALAPHHCIWFTVDDLEYLKRGGRVSPTAAFVGGLLGIKPVLQMDDPGHLIKVSTVRGRKKALEALADQFGARADKDTPVFISHAQCLADAQQLADILLERYGAQVTNISDIGPIIGAHAGPGTIAMFFIGSHR